MIRCRQRVYQFVKVVFWAVFIMSLSLYPLDNSTEEGAVNSSASAQGQVSPDQNTHPDHSIPKNTSPVPASSGNTSMDTPLHHMAYHNSPVLIAQKDLFSIIEFISNKNRNSKDNRKILGGSFCFDSLFLIWMTVFAIISSYRMSNNRISLLSLKIGGHAPPCMFRIA